MYRNAGPGLERLMHISNIKENNKRPNPSSSFSSYKNNFDSKRAKKEINPPTSITSNNKNYSTSTYSSSSPLSKSIKEKKPVIKKEEKKEEEKQKKKEIEYSSLSPEQKEIVEIVVKQGKSVFFTGPGGVGKSHLLKYLIQILPSQTTYVTGSTGIAAVALEGGTLHHFAGIGRGEESVEELTTAILSKSPKNAKTAHFRWKNCKILIIDEISMINGYLFDKLNRIGQIIRQDSTKPFGGIQLILCGDGLQLPPVKCDKYIVDASCWSTCIDISKILKQPFRQQEDSPFLKALNELRYGICSLETIQLIEKTATNELQEINGIIPTKIFTTNQMVRDENIEQLEALQEDKYEFICSQDAEDLSYKRILEKDCPALHTIHLKIGAQVMLLRNLDTEIGLCNGARGIITGFTCINSTIQEQEEQEEEEEKEERKEGEEEKPKEKIVKEVVEENGKWGGKRITFNYLNKNNKNNIPSSCEKSKVYLPRVRFENGVEIIVESFRFELKNRGLIMAYRKQLPLMLSWAINVHRIQGQTLTRAIVDLSGVFCDAQLYVALSRVKTIEGLCVKNFKKEYVKTNQRMINFYKNLE